MKLTVVGSSGSYPGPDSPASCYLLEADHEGRTWRILLDLGNGSLGALHRHADPLQIDAVLLSHLHADHCLDLCGYYVMRKYHPLGVQPQIPVWGPPGTADRLAVAYELPLEEGMHEEFAFASYDGTEVRIGPFVIDTVGVNHPVDAYALRVRCEGRTLVYSGDTATCAELTEHAKAADLFLCEASFMETADNPPDIHLTGAEAGQVATDAGVRRMLLTHIPPWHDRHEVLAEAVTTYAGDVGLAEPGTSYLV